MFMPVPTTDILTWVLTVAITTHTLTGSTTGIGDESSLSCGVGLLAELLPSVAGNFPMFTIETSPVGVIARTLTTELTDGTGGSLGGNGVKAELPVLLGLPRKFCFPGIPLIVLSTTFEALTIGLVELSENLTEREVLDFKVVDMGVYKRILPILCSTNSHVSDTGTEGGSIGVSATTPIPLIPTPDTARMSVTEIRSVGERSLSSAPGGGFSRRWNVVGGVSNGWLVGRSNEDVIDLVDHGVHELHSLSVCGAPEMVHVSPNRGVSSDG